MSVSSTRRTTSRNALVSFANASVRTRSPTVISSTSTSATRVQSSNSIVGAMVAEKFVVEPGHVLRFKRAIGYDVDAVGADDGVPPTFTVASVDDDPEWWLR